MINGLESLPCAFNQTSDFLARDNTLFSFQKWSCITLLVASSAMAFAPFSQYSNGDGSDGSGHAQPGQSNPVCWFARLSVMAESIGPMFAIPCFQAETTAGSPAATSFTGPRVGCLKLVGPVLEAPLPMTLCVVTRVYACLKIRHSPSYCCHSAYASWSG